MLKIKDSVGLSTLEQHDFGVGNWNPFAGEMQNKDKYFYLSDVEDSFDYIYIDIKTRIIDSACNDKLFDLIQAGLVEKVEVK